MRPSEDVRVNRKLWNSMWIIMAIQLVVIGFMYDWSKESDNDRKDLNISMVIGLNYPEVICQAGDSYDYRVYKKNEYKIIPDMYDDDHLLIRSTDANGSLIPGNSFSTSRCTINDINLFKGKK